MELSRRALLGSAIAFAAVRIGSLSVLCSLDESRKAFQGLPPVTGAAIKGGVLVELSVGLATENLAWLRRKGIFIHEPRTVQGPAWIHFDWPISAMIRDFGRVSPISGGVVIARLYDMPVAVRQGQLVVLGSPLGPHVYAGDRDACALLTALTQLP
jgi:hypothetical protein